MIDWRLAAYWIFDDMIFIDGHRGFPTKSDGDGGRSTCGGCKTLALRII